MNSHKTKKLTAFTLAETLVALAIMGIVASLIIPSAIKNYNKKVYATKLKNFYVNFNSAFKTTMARDGVSTLSKTKMWSKMTSTTASSVQFGSTTNQEFLEDFTKNINISKIYSSKFGLIPSEQRVKYKYLNNKNARPKTNGIFLTNGTYITFTVYKTPHVASCGGKSCTSLKEFQENRGSNTKLWQYIGMLYVDVNGFKGPNTYGRDYFSFYIGNDGALYPMGGLDYAIYVNASCSEKNLSSCSYHWSANNISYGCNIEQRGMGCAGRVMEENWQMTY